jgi:hypothetical protein
MPETRTMSLQGSAGTYIADPIVRLDSMGLLTIVIAGIIDGDSNSCVAMPAQSIVLNRRETELLTEFLLPEAKSRIERLEAQNKRYHDLLEATVKRLEKSDSLTATGDIAQVLSEIASEIY